MKNGMPKIIFNQIKEDNYTTEYAAHLAIMCYKQLQNKIEEYKDKYKCLDNDEIEKLSSPEIISTMMQIAYNENHAINNNKSIILKTVRRDDYYNKYIKRDDCTLYEGDIEEEL